MGSTATKFTFTITLVLVLAGCGAEVLTSREVLGPEHAQPEARRALPPQMDASITCQEARQSALLTAKQTDDSSERMTKLAFIPVCP